MSRVLGVHIRVQGNYVAGFAVVDRLQLIDEHSLAAPAEAESRQLAELYTRTTDLIRRYSPIALVIRASEGFRGPGDAKAVHAEGVVMSAAGERNLEVALWHGRGLVKPSGLPGNPRTKEAVESLCTRLAPIPTRPETQQAAAAALAELLKRGYV